MAKDDVPHIVAVLVIEHLEVVDVHHYGAEGHGQGTHGTEQYGDVPVEDLPGRKAGNRVQLHHPGKHSCFIVGFLLPCTFRHTITG